MAYEKQTWTTGEVITQEKLNHMEDGIANAGVGIMVVHFSGVPNSTSITADKTRGEIIQAFDAGMVVIGFYAIEEADVYYADFVKCQTGGLSFTINSDNYGLSPYAEDTATQWDKY